MEGKRALTDASGVVPSSSQSTSHCSLCVQAETGSAPTGIDYSAPRLCSNWWSSTAKGGNAIHR